MSTRISTLQAAILKAVAHYRFLTHSQMLLLDLGKPGAIRKATWYLCRHPPRAPYLQSHQVAPHARFGQVEKVFAISKKGLQVLAECFPHFQLPKTRPVSAFYDADFFHRRETISFRIRLEQALRKEPDFLLTHYANYFERTPHQGSKSYIAATRVSLGVGQICIPDSIFDIVHKPKGARATFAFEYVRGSKRPRTIQQMETHQAVLRFRALASHRQLPLGQNSLALFVFEDANLCQHILRYARDHPHWLSPFSHHFHLKSLAETDTHILKGWMSLDSGKPLHLLKGSTKDPA